MIWALLAILGIPIWFIAGLLLAVWLIRRNFKEQPGVFEIAMREEDAATWPRSMTYGRLVRDVLVVNRGAAFLRAEIHAVDAVSELEISESPKKPARAVGRLLTLDDGSRWEVAVAGDGVAQLDALATRGKSDRRDESAIPGRR